MKTGTFNQKIETAKRNESQATVISKSVFKGTLLLLAGSGLLVLTVLKDGKAIMANDISFEIVLFFPGRTD